VVPNQAQLTSTSRLYWTGRLVSGKFLMLQIAREGALGVKRKRNAEDPAEGRALRFAVLVSVTLLLFSVLAHWIPFGGVPKGGAAFNQLTVAQFLGGVGGGIGAVIVGATLWLQLRALGDLRRISQTSHQFEAYALWRALDASITQATVMAVVNVLSALLAEIRDDVLLDPDESLETILNQRWYQDKAGVGSMTTARTSQPAGIQISLFGKLHAKVTAEYDAEDGNTSPKLEIVELTKSYSYNHVAKIIQNLERITDQKPTMLSNENLADDDVRRVRQLSLRFIMHLYEAENLNCVAQCVGLISDPAVRQYLDILVRIRADSAARTTFEYNLQHDTEGRIENMLVGSIFWDSDDVLAWRSQAAEARQQ
jgi:hypothetical protein